MLTLTALCVDACARRTLGLQEGDLLDMLGSCARGALSMSLLAGGRLQPRLLNLHPAWRCGDPSRARMLTGEGVGRGCVGVSVRARAGNGCAGSQSQLFAKYGRMQAWRARSRSCAACASAAAARAPPCRPPPAPPCAGRTPGCSRTAPAGSPQPMERPPVCLPGQHTLSRAPCMQPDSRTAEQVASCCDGTVVHDGAGLSSQVKSAARPAQACTACAAHRQGSLLFAAPLHWCAVRLAVARAPGTRRSSCASRRAGAAAADRARRTRPSPAGSPARAAAG